MSASHNKRKQPDELVADLLSNVSISSTKRFRLDNGLYPIIEEPQVVSPADTPPVILSNDASLLPLEATLPSALLPRVPADEKAIVLYKPVNPPLFPGGPPAGSSELPLRLNSPLSHKVRLAQNIPPFCTVDKVYGDYLSSFHNLSSYQGDVTESDFREQPDNSLAVIPWLPPSPVLSSFTSNGTVQTPSFEADSELAVDGESFSHEDEVDEMKIDEGEEMAVEEGDCLDPNANSTPWGNLIPNSNPPSSHFPVLQPPYPSSMWSV